MTRKESISMKSGFISFLGILTVLLSGLPCSVTASDRFPNPSAPDFPIAAWKTFKLNSIPTEQEFKWLKDAGINVVSEMFTDSTIINTVLDKTASHGMKMVVGGDYVTDLNHIRSLAPRLKGNKGLLGYYLVDEPKDPNAFSNWVRYRNAISNADPTALSYINLWPATPQYSNDYQAYIDNYVKTFNPQVISVDIYPVRTVSENVFRTYSRYYETYEILNKKSKQYHIPWMACCAATSTPEFQAPNDINMRFATFTALAYGAQSICWWTYQLPTSSPGFFKNAPIVNGKRTQAWYDMKTVNQEIQRYKEVFLDCDVVRTFLADNITSTSSEYKVNRINTSPISMPLSPGSIDIYWKGAGTGFTTGYVFSQIRNNGHEYLVIVSQDWEQSQTLLLKTQGTCVLMNPDGSETTLSATSSKTIPAGGYLILRLY